MAIGKAISPDNALTMTLSCRLMDNTLFRLSCYSEAISFYVQEKELRDNHDKNGIRRGWFSCQTGKTCQIMMDTKAAEQHFLEAMELLEQARGHQFSGLFSPLCQLAELYAEAGKPEQVQPLLDRARSIMAEHQ